ncbi:MAG: AI-2E family transporter [Bacillota bacterium]
MELNKNNVKKILLIITFGLVLFWALSNPASALKIFRGLLALLSPFLLGGCLAFIINVLLRPLERLWDKVRAKIRKKGASKRAESFKRPVCILLSTLIIAALFVFLFFMVVPEIRRTGEMIISMLPQYLAQIDTWWNSLAEFLRQYSIALPQDALNLKQIGQSVSNFLSTAVPAFFSSTLAITTSVFGVVFNFVLGFVFALYILAQKETLGRQITKLCRAYLPEAKAERFLEIASLSNRTFGNFVTGQLTEAFIIGILCFIGMTVFSIPYAPMISVLVGFTALIPVFGAFIGTAIGAFLILMVEPVKAFWFVVFIIVLQQLEGNLIYPKVVGKSVGLSGIWVLAAVTIGGTLFGVTGILFGVPVCSVLYAVLRQNVNRRLAAKEQEPSAEQSLAVSDGSSAEK